MKQMRSRFRLISLLLACTLALAVAACAVSVLRENGFTLPPPRQELPASPSHVPETSSEAPPELSPEASADMKSSRKQLTFSRIRSIIYSDCKELPKGMID